ncbi:fibrinogen-binding adhesin SdrG C-terminal domain-containing protein [Staphylococcus haemolyticus]|uniref:fibrinogen-binding adhesin SdrG C-terminal domain-containing protein n=1 Tax=Staphylococcus haemolyticus TaxID=1283 RepID=UPI0029045F8D|nr:fibrinogen-binding adhesin SdrG C-terminal domain-containing protein [Staphylococcus haemolyticus]MDU0423576.1 fibrinogen-binding adhesin SdrG C-terminal domain-containing protein [Staphylococcus haemolyticus]MDU0440775.1 fibrinogen-binding adhesin SdrG C-terminal domain-containing protein [Staphylococcus haemolyticus]MDU0442796.1 fibrinogen-binding adhesin SdrG C-terminal domain-containing protein [Staphylococcus haemolyticus]MDU0474921.1 fibrinogen-binding adhesin SdrG C-terminal domain-co
MFTHLDLDNQTVEQTVYVNPLRYTANNTEVTINGTGPNGSTIIDDSTEIKIYKVADDQYLPDSNRIYDYSQYENVTNDYPISVNGDDTDSDADADADADADSEKENNELPGTGSDEKNGVILGSLFAAIGTLLLGKNRRKINDKK